MRTVIQVDYGTWIVPPGVCVVAELEHDRLVFVVMWGPKLLWLSTEPIGRA